MKFDEALQQYVGEFGRHQMFLVSLLSMVLCSAGAQVMITVFTLHLPSHRCADPEINDSYSGLEVSVLRQRPGASLKYQLLECFIEYNQTRNESEAAESIPDFDKNLSLYVKTGPLLIPSSNVSVREKCHRWVFDQSVFTSTIATEMNFVCDRKLLISHAVMFLMVGQMIGCLFGGPAADVLGRKKLMLVTLLFHFIVSVLTSWVTSMVTLSLVYLLNGTALSGAYCSAFTMSLELVGPRWRHVVGMFITAMWSVGILFVGMLAFFIRDWQILQLAASLPGISFLLFLCFLPESPRWLARKGRYSEAEEILMRIAKKNNKTVAGKIELTSEDNEGHSQSQSLVVFLRCPPLLKRFAVVLLNWFICSLIYFGLSLNVGHLSGNIFLNFVLSGILELIGYSLVALLLSRVGRKTIYCSSLLVGSMGCLLTVLPVLIGGAWSTYGVRVLAMTGKFGIASAFAILWLFTPEMFPTSLRVGVTGASSCSARLGGIAASYLANLTLAGSIGHLLPQIIFGTLGLTAGLAALRLPETNQVRLPDSVKDAMDLKKHKPRQVLQEHENVLLT